MPIIEQGVAGAAEPTTIASPMSPTVPGSGQTFSVDSDAGYPSGVAFTVVIDRGQASEEKVLIASRSGTTFTVDQRGYDGTTASTHTSGSATCEHALAAAIVQLVIDHVDDVEVAPHATALPVGTIAGHDNETRHQFGSGLAFGVPVTPTALTPDIAGAAGSGNNPAREDHVHNVPAAAASTSGLSNTEGSSGSFARADHTHDQAALSVDTAELVNLAVTSGKLAADAVTAGKIAAGGVAATDELADAIITLAKFASEASSDWAPTAASFSSAANLTVGTGGTTYGHYFKLGRLVVGWCGFAMAADGNLPAGSSIRVPLPVAMRTAGADGQRGFVAARARRASDGFISSGTGVITSGTQFGQNIATAGASAEWDATTPFNWGNPGDGASQLDAVFFYEAAA